MRAEMYKLTNQDWNLFLTTRLDEWISQGGDKSVKSLLNHMDMNLDEFIVWRSTGEVRSLVKRRWAMKAGEDTPAKDCSRSGPHLRHKWIQGRRSLQCSGRTDVE